MMGLCARNLLKIKTTYFILFFFNFDQAKVGIFNLFSPLWLRLGKCTTNTAGVLCFVSFSNHG